MVRRAYCSETNYGYIANTITKACWWRRHLRWRKRDQAKKERQAAKRGIRDESQEQSRGWRATARFMAGD
jgi:hypothetical protein